MKFLAHISETILLHGKKNVLITWPLSYKTPGSALEYNRLLWLEE